MKKYKLTNMTTEHNGRTLYRIKALRDFGNVKAGDYGGFVQSEGNLSHRNNCWITECAMALDRSLVTGDALLSGRSIIWGDAIIDRRATINGNVYIGEGSYVGGCSEITGNVFITGEIISGNAFIRSDRDHFTITNTMQSIRTVTAYKGNDGKTYISFSLFSTYQRATTLDEFEKKVRNELFDDESQMQFCLKLLELIKLRFSMNYWEQVTK